MGIIFDELGSQVKTDFLGRSGEAYEEDGILRWESVRTSCERLIGGMAIDPKTQFLKEILKENLGNDPEIAILVSEEVSASTVINALITEVLALELLRSDEQLAAEDVRRYKAFEQADDARHAART